VSSTLSPVPAIAQAIIAAAVAARPAPRVVEGHLTQPDEQAVFRWVVRNEAALVAYWDGQIGTIELGQRLSPAVPP
jgi:hypothetical protein